MPNANTIEIRIEAANLASSVFKQVGDDANLMGNHLQDAGSKGSSAFGNIASSAAGFVAGGAITAGIGMVKDFGGSIITTAADFEQKMSDIQAATNATGDELGKLKQLALDMGAQTQFSAGEAADGITNLSLAGMSTADIMGGGLKSSLDLAAAGQISVGEAAETTSNALNMFGLKAGEAAHVADVLVGAASASSASMGDMEQGLAAAGAVAHTLGLSLDDTSTAIALMANNGLKGSDAGTSLKTMMLNLHPATKQATEQMMQLGIITADGSNKFYDAAGNVRSLADISQVLKDSLSGLSKEQQVAALQTMFGSDAIRAGSILAGAGAVKFNELEASVTAQGQASAKSKILNDNFNSSMGALGGTIDTIKTQVGMALLPTLKDMADGFNGLLGDMMDGKGVFGEIGNAIGVVAGFFGNLASAVGSLIQPIETVINAVSGPLTAAFNALLSGDIGGFASGVMDAFHDLQLGLLNMASGLAESALNWLVQATSNIGPAMSSFVNGIITKLEELGPGIIQKAGEFYSNIIGWATQAANNIIPLIGQFVGNILSGITTLIQDSGPKLVELAGKFIGWIGEMLPKLGTELGKFISTVIGKVGELIGQVVPKLGELAGTFLNWVVKDVIPNIVPKLVQFGGKLIEGIGNIIGQVAPKLGELALGFVSWLGQAIINLPGKLLEWGGVLLKGIADTLGQLLPKLGDMAKAFWTWLTDTAIPNLVKGLGDFAQKIWDWLTGLIGSIPGKFLDAGKAMVTGIWNGISGAWDWLTGNVHDDVNKLGDNTKTIAAVAGDAVGTTFDSAMALAIHAKGGSVNVASQSMMHGLLQYTLGATTAAHPIGEAFDGLIAQGILDKAFVVFNTAMNVMNQTLGPLFTAMGIGNPLGGLAHMSGALLSMNLAAGITSKAKNAIDAATKVMTDANTAATAQVPSFVPVGASIPPAIGSGIDSKGGTSGPVASAAKDVVSTAADAATTQSTKDMTAVGQAAAQHVANGFTEDGPIIAGHTKDAITAASKDATETAKQMGGAQSAAIASGVESNSAPLANAVSDVMQKALDAGGGASGLGSLGGAINTSIDSLGQMLTAAMDKLTPTLSNWIANALPAVREQMDNLASILWKWADDTAVAASSLFEEVGKAIDDAIGNAIDAGAGGIADKAVAVAKAAYDAAMGALAGAGTAPAGTTGGTGGGGINAMFGPAGITAVAPPPAAPRREREDGGTHVTIIVNGNGEEAIGRMVEDKLERVMGNVRGYRND